MIDAITLLKVARSALPDAFRRPLRVELGMTITQTAFGERLEKRRGKKGLSLAEASQELDRRFRLRLSVDDLGAIESGRKKVSTYEFESFRALYGGELEDYLRQESSYEEIATELNLATRGSRAPRESTNALIDCLAVHYEMANLKEFCCERSAGPIAYALTAPRDTREAKTQGRAIADSERQRLQLGGRPVVDIYRLLDEQGLDISFQALPEDISGAMLSQRGRRNPFVIVNEAEIDGRKAFSLAHEYAHVLLDRTAVAAVSFRDKSDDLREVRADAFAVAFLMPETGIRDAVSTLASEGGPIRRAPRLDAEGVANLAKAFGVSRTAMIYRLRELKYLRNAAAGEAIKAQFRASGDTETASSAPSAFTVRFTQLAKKAALTHKISRGKFKELMGHVGVPRSCALELLDAEGS